MTYQSANDDPQTYYYVLNLQGDVVKLVDVSGAAFAMQRRFQKEDAVHIPTRLSHKTKRKDCQAELAKRSDRFLL